MGLTIGFRRRKRWQWWTGCNRKLHAAAGGGTIGQFGGVLVELTVAEIRRSFGILVQHFVAENLDFSWRSWPIWEAPGWLSCGFRSTLRNCSSEKKEYCNCRETSQELKTNPEDRVADCGLLDRFPFSATFFWCGCSNSSLFRCLSFQAVEPQLQTT